MIYWVRIIFLGILSLLVFQSMEENVISAYMTDTCAENILSDTDKNISFEESSSDDYLLRTINHILKSRYAELSVSACIFTSGCKNNNDSKFTQILSGKETCNNTVYKHYCTDREKHFNRHNLINSPKEYYIYTLEKIII